MPNTTIWLLEPKLTSCFAQVCVMGVIYAGQDAKLTLKPWIAMELCESGSLHNFLHNETVTPEWDILARILMYEPTLQILQIRKFSTYL